MFSRRVLNFRWEHKKPYSSFWFCLVSFSLLLISFSNPCSLYAQSNRQSVSKELESLHGQIEREQKRLGDLYKRQFAINESLKFATEELAQIRRQKKSLNELLGKLLKRTIRLERAVAKGKDVILNERDSIDKRIVAIYKMYRRSGTFSYLVSANSATDLLKRAGFMSRIAAFDRERLHKFWGIIGSFEKEKRKLEDITDTRHKHLLELEKLETSLKIKKEEEAVILEESKKEEQNRKATLKKLQKSADRLETILSRIMGTETIGHVKKTVREEDSKKTSSSLKAKTIGKVEAFSGHGLDSRRGQLMVPIKGRLVQRFGKRKHEEFSDMLFSKGLEFASRPGGRIVAVASGKVVFSKILPGYGNVIILDHGNRYYTLYGRLASTVKHVGDVVEEGALIAVAGQLDSKGRNFYFELRIRGKPVDPLGYLMKNQVLTEQG